MKSLFQEIAITILLALAFYLLLSTSIQTFLVLGDSMRPSLQNRQRLIVNKVIYFFREPRRGEVIILKRPVGPDYVKRVVAIPGDTIEIRPGVVLLNGKPVEEPYILEPPRYTLGLQTIPPGHYFLLGDNRNDSLDSHLFGTVPKGDILGMAWVSIWPPQKWGLAPNYPLTDPGQDRARSAAVQESRRTEAGPAPSGEAAAVQGF